MTRKISGPRGSNEYSNPPDPISPEGWEDSLGVEPAGMAPGTSFNRNPPITSKTQRRCAGPAMSKINELEYKGT